MIDSMKCQSSGSDLLSGSDLRSGSGRNPGSCLRSDSSLTPDEALRPSFDPDLLLDKYRGCLLGGAAGDALGNPVEFKSDREIRAIYGPEGIQDYDLTRGDGLGRITDDTQMTLATAAGILFGFTYESLTNRCEDPESYIYQAYLDWYQTQNPSFDEAPHITHLCHEQGLYALRGPGTTCLTALASGEMGSTMELINNSKGCGGVMRVAPVGLAYHLEDAPYVAAEAAAITHGHPLGFISAAALAYLVNRCAFEVDPLATEDLHSRRQVLSRFLADVAPMLADCFPDFPEDVERQVGLLVQARKLAENTLSDDVNIPVLGEGWVGEEALAIAVYAALRYCDDFDACLRAAVNHSGDSDSTGAIAGNILGALMGYGAIAPRWTENLQLADLVDQIACDLHRAGHMTSQEFAEASWREKYYLIEEQ